MITNWSFRNDTPSVASGYRAPGAVWGPTHLSGECSENCGASRTRLPGAEPSATTTHRVPLSKLLNFCTIAFSSGKWGYGRCLTRTVAVKVAHVIGEGLKSMPSSW